MNFFKKDEIVVISLVLLILVSFSFVNFRTALRKSRDAQRRSDVSDIANAVEKFHSDFGKFPMSTENGQLKACEPEDLQVLLDRLENESNFTYTDYLNALSPCEWGEEDGLQDFTGTKNLYLKKLPTDPKSGEGMQYHYISNGNYYQVYSYLEGEEAALGFNEQVVERGLSCGVKICSFGKSYGKLPLDKSIQEYENELRNQQ